MTKPVRKVKFKLGGIEHSCVLQFRLVLDIEDVIDIGIINLVQLVYERKAKIAQIAELIRLTLKANKVVYTHDQVVNQIGMAPIGDAHGTAVVILSALITPPEEALGNESRTAEETE